MAELPALRTASDEARVAAEHANDRFSQICRRFNAGVRHGQEASSPAMRVLVEDGRRERDRLAGVANLAKKHLDNAVWRISCFRDDIDQLDRAANPPPIEHRPEVVQRRKPEIGNYDRIVMPERAA
jgi:hypothetical protein